MAFVDAVFDGATSLVGVHACRIDVPDYLAEQTAGRLFLPIVTVPFEVALIAAPWSVLVDARMRKRTTPECQQGLARLTIGLGPGFVATETVDIAIETAWGDRLGAIITAGPTSVLAGEPKPIDGVGRERVVYAPSDGIWHTRRSIGDAIDKGQLVGWQGETPVFAPLTGILCGVTRNDVPCARHQNRRG